MPLTDDSNSAGRQPPRQGERARRWLERLWRAARTYPLPLFAVVMLALSGVLTLAGYGQIGRWPLTAVIVVGGVPLLIETVKQLVHREFGVDLLALLAIAGSFVLGEYLAGAVIVLMFSGGEALEAIALRRARKSLSALAERAPREAHVRQGDHLMTIPADEVEVGMQVVVKAGEMIPVDGVVVEGDSSVSEADLTGEPLPVRKQPGALALSGSVNLDGLLEITATKRCAESQYAQIVRLVEQAQSSKAPIHRLADRYAVWFTAIALTIAAIAWIRSGDPVYGLAVLVVATPCPLILATPIAIMSGIDRAARQGLIIKNGAAIEALGEVDTAVFDKTGTLTLGTPKFIELVPAVESDSEPVQMTTLLTWVASVEQFSPHILARAVVEAARDHGLRLVSVTNVREVPGKGLAAHVREPASAQGAPGHEVAVGNRTYMGQLNVAIPAEAIALRERLTGEGKIVSFVAVDGALTGLLVFADVPRAEIKELTPRLKSEGIRTVALLTGDGPTVAQRIGAEAGVDQVVAQCLPQDKVRTIREFEDAGRRVLMVGDGVNDAPALASATLGIAMGAQGLTAASAAADAVLLSTNILRIPGAVHLGRRVMRVARQGIWVGIGLSTIAMIVAAAGYITPTQGAILQEGIDVLVILNALRAGRPGPDERGEKRPKP